MELFRSCRLGLESSGKLRRAERSSFTNEEKGISTLLNFGNSLSFAKDVNNYQLHRFESIKSHVTAITNFIPLCLLEIV